MILIKKIILLITLFCVIFATNDLYSSDSSITKIRFSGSSKSLRVIIDVDNLSKWEISPYTNPSRIAVDLYKVKFDKSFPLRSVLKGCITIFGKVSVIQK